MNFRPNLTKNISTNDFQEFYWLKSELAGFCKEIGISSSGGKIEISDRIVKYLKTGEIPKKHATTKTKLQKATLPITKETIIGIEYRSYKEKKEFMKSVIGSHFHFTIHLLDYVKRYSGVKKYADLINEWYLEQERKKDPDFIKEISPQFEYNIYIRDFLKDNPDKSKKEAIEYWKIKRARRGDNKYSKDDLL